MAQRVSAVPHSENGRWQSRSAQLDDLHDHKENTDAFYRLKAQGQAVVEKELLDELARQAVLDNDVFVTDFGGGGGGDGSAGGDGGGAAGGGDGGAGGGSDGGGGSGGSDGGGGDGGSGGDGGE